MAKTSENMDYAEHEQTFAFFINLLKFSIAALAICTVALYAFIIEGNFWLGLVLLAVSVPAGIGAVMLGRNKG